MKKRVFKLFSVIILIIVIIIGILPIFNYSQAIENLKPGEVTTDLSRVDRTRYPGIVERISILKNKYPNWEFELYKTGLDWNEFIKREYAPERTRSPFNLIPSTLRGTWVCEYRGTKTFDSGSWYAASYQAVEFVIDPRTYLNEYDVFSFKRVAEKANILSEANSLVIINSALENASYSKHAKTIYTIAKEENVDFVDVLARLIQEQGTGTVLSDGNRSIDPNDKKLYFNPYNIRASGDTAAQIIRNGTEYAKNKGWDTFAKGLRGGIQLVKENYEKQNTAYFEKFNATESDYSGVTHQYMQNVIAPFNEGEFKKNMYQKIDPTLKNGVYTFVVPLYENMQKAATDAPNQHLPTPKGKTYVPPLKINPTMLGKTKEYRQSVNQNNSTLPSRAETNYRVSIKYTVNGNTRESIPFKSVISIREEIKEGKDTWYKIFYKLNKNGGFNSMGYILRDAISDNYDFAYLDIIDVTKLEPLPTDPIELTENERILTEQSSATLPFSAVLTTDVKIRKSPSLSSTVIRTLPKGTRISVREKKANKDGYEWYYVYYNQKDLKFQNAGMIARNKVRSNIYYFKYIENADWLSCPYVLSLNSQEDSTENTENKITLPKRAKTTVRLKIRSGSGSLSSPIRQEIGRNSTLSVRKRMPDKNGYEWYYVYYNLVNGKFKNAGYVERNKVGSTDYYFEYIDLSNSTNTENPILGSSTLPKRAKTTTRLKIRSGSGSLSSPIRQEIGRNSTLSVRKRMPNKDGYEWYYVYYNLVDGKFKNAGYVERNKVGSTDYYFEYIDLSNTTNNENPILGSSNLPKRAKTTVRLNIRSGSGSLLSPIRQEIGRNSTLSVRKRMPDKDGYEWYYVYYNLVDGKFQNAGYAARNSIGSTDYYFNYI